MTLLQTGIISCWSTADITSLPYSTLAPLTILSTAARLIFFLNTNLIMSLSYSNLLVKHLPTMSGTHIQSLGWEDLLQKEMATHSSIIAWKIPWMEEPGCYSPQGHKKLDTTE